MGKRVKSASVVIQVGDWEECDNLVREVGDLQLAIQAAEARAKEIIDEAKAEMQENVKPFQQRIKDIARAVEHFAAAHKSDFVGQKQSKQLAHGKIGWRKSLSMRISKATLGLLKSLLGKEAIKYMRIKEEVDRNALYNLSEDHLEKIDARRMSKQTFFVEPDMPEAVDRAD